MKILVTGGAGFIGSHTVDSLLLRGHSVKILDNLQKSVHLKGKPSYIPKEAEFIFGDVRDKKALEYALENVEAVYHFAAYQDYLPDFSTYFHVNAVSTALIYEIIVEKKLPVKKVIVASSQAVLGEGLYKCGKCETSNVKREKAGYQMPDAWCRMPDTGYQKPDARCQIPDEGGNSCYYQPDIRVEQQLAKGEWEHRCPECGEVLQYLPTPEERINPKNQYALSKHSQESIAISLGRRYDIPSVALRYSIVQGPRQSFYNAYSGANRIFSLNLFLDRAPTIYEDGRQVRDFVNIQDVVDANLLVLERDEANYQVFNVGGGKSYTVLEFYDIVREVFEKDIEPKIPGAYRYGDTRNSLSDISKLKSLGWEPRYSPGKSVQDYKTYLEEQTDIQDILDYAEAQMKMMNVVRNVKC
jgi:dTDP-L-rhamnose 4-epimerase